MFERFHDFDAARSPQLCERDGLGSAGRDAQAVVVVAAEIRRSVLLVAPGAPELSEGSRGSHPFGGRAKVHDGTIDALQDATLAGRGTKDMIRIVQMR